MLKLVERVVQLGELLRSEGFAVSTSEVIDATESLRYLDLMNKSALNACLRSALMKRPDPSGVFNRCFEAAFGSATSSTGTSKAERTSDEDRPANQPPAAGGPLPASAEILEALLSGDQEALETLARQAVDMYGNDEGSATERRIMQRVVRAIDLSRMLSAAMQRLRSANEPDELELALRRSEISTLIEEFRRQLAAQIDQRLRGADWEHEPAVRSSPRPEDTDLHEILRSDYDEIQKVIAPLMRQTAARVARKRKRRSTGRLDPRGTVRRSLQSGGVPFDVVQRRRHPSRPDIVILCDVSGSVAEFARFTFTLVHAAHKEVGRVRSFAFVDGIAEVTDVFREARVEVPVNRLVDREGVIGPDGHSNYGAAFSAFTRLYLEGSIGSQTTVVISGDARSNYRDGGVSEFEKIADRARRVYWLNPEPAPLWGTTDSLMESYRKSCTAVHEVRTIRQLARAVSELA